MEVAQRSCSGYRVLKYATEDTLLSDACQTLTCVSKDKRGYQNYRKISFRVVSRFIPRCAGGSVARPVDHGVATQTREALKQIVLFMAGVHTMWSMSFNGRAGIAVAGYS